MLLEDGLTGETKTTGRWTDSIVGQVVDLLNSNDDLYQQYGRFSFVFVENVLNSLIPDMKPGKAFAKQLVKAGVKLPKTLVAEVGNILASMPEDDVTLLLTFGSEGDRSEYYNSRSCWWTDFPRSRDVLLHNGGGAIRAYRSGTLIGRVWFLPVDDWLVLFNFYGEGSLQHAQTWAAATSQAFGWITAVQSTDFPVAKRDLYTNSTTVVVAGERIAPRIESVRLEVESAPYIYATPRVPCERCGTAYEVGEMEEFNGMFLDGYYCWSCRQDFRRISAGEYEGEWCHVDDTVDVAYQTYYYTDSSIHHDPLGRTCLLEDAIEVDSELYAPYSVVYDVYKTPHVRDSGTYFRCPHCRKYYPISDREHLDSCPMKPEESNLYASGDWLGNSLLFFDDNTKQSQTYTNRRISFREWYAQEQAREEMAQLNRMYEELMQRIAADQLLDEEAEE